MKRTIIFCIAVMLMAATAHGQTETAMRTLDLPVEYSITNGFITDYKITKSLVITQTVDRSKSVKTISPTGKAVYTNAPTLWNYELKETRNELNDYTNVSNPNTSGTYLPNFIAMQLHQPKVYISAANVYEYQMDRIDPTNSGSWIAARSTKIEMLNDKLILLTELSELGGSQNVIPRIFLKRVNNTGYYKNPVDYLGRAIVGDTVYNQGAPASAMNVKFANRVVQVTLITKTLQGSGTWTTSTGVWSGGVKTFTNTSSAYVPVADLPSLFGNSIEELEYDLRTEIYCTPIPQDKPRITSTSTEIVISGNTYKGITYYSGIDAGISKPTGQIASYNKAYPGHVNRWILKQWNQDGSVVSGTGNLGQVWMQQYSSSENNEIKIIPGTVTHFDANTQTLTYNSNLRTELWYEMEELPAQGKNWNWQSIVKL